jgi:hypothetical protein
MKQGRLPSPLARAGAPKGIFFSGAASIWVMRVRNQDPTSRDSIQSALPSNPQRLSLMREKHPLEKNSLWALRGEAT